jgi:hypothetical protein
MVEKVPSEDINQAPGDTEYSSQSGEKLDTHTPDSSQVIRIQKVFTGALSTWQFFRQVPHMHTL